MPHIPHIPSVPQELTFVNRLQWGLCLRPRGPSHRKLLPRRPSSRGSARVAYRGLCKKPQEADGSRAGRGSIPGAPGDRSLAHRGSVPGAPPYPSPSHPGSIPRPPGTCPVRTGCPSSARPGEVPAPPAIAHARVGYGSTPGWRCLLGAPGLAPRVSATRRRAVRRNPRPARELSPRQRVGSGRALGNDPRPARQASPPRAPDPSPPHPVPIAGGVPMDRRCRDYPRGPGG